MSLCIWLISFLFVLFFSSGESIAEKSSLSAGQKAPQFSLIDTNNISWISKNFFNNDRLVIFYFFDIESEACRQELKFLSSINKNNADDVDILAITSNASDTLSSFIRDEKLNLTILIDKDREVSNLYHAMSVFPTTFFINEKGDIIEVVVGSPGDTEAILSLLLNSDKKKEQSEKAVEEESVAASPEAVVLPRENVAQKKEEKTARAPKSPVKPKTTETALANGNKSGYKTYKNGEEKSKVEKKKLPQEIADYIRNLESSDFASKRDAAKRIYRGKVNHPQLFATLSREIKKGYMVSDSDRLQVDSIAWLCKAIAVSGMPEARSVLNEVIAGTPSKKIKKHALKSLNSL
jgi:peroxiredoxin Q/BCP